MTRVALFALFLLGCPIIPDPVEPGPIPPEPRPSGASCTTMCDNMRELHCEAAKPTAGGASCEDVCENVQSSGIISWNLECRSSANTCEDVDNCER